MKKVVDETLDAMVRSLREHLDHANEMGLTLTAQLLKMALIELRAELHDISPQDIEALCRLMEEQASPRMMSRTAQVIPFPGGPPHQHSRP
jgi:CBS-domain-containing membrane protein